MKNEDVHQIVRENYAEIARQSSPCCGPRRGGGSSDCCCGSSAGKAEAISKNIGYSDEDLASVPEGANLGLGCGNPVALASLKPGEVVLDLGSGAGFDCFLASSRVGPQGRVIGVDMTPEMLDKARENARKGNYKNVEFRLGEIENLPLADNSVNVIISNCVINLSSDKARVFQEAFRVLQPGGRLMVSDIVLLKELPEFIRESAAGYVSCISGAILKSEYLKAINEAGFIDVTIADETVYPLDDFMNDPALQGIMEDLGMTPEQGKDIAGSISSIRVSGLKPA